MLTNTGEIHVVISDVGQHSPKHVVINDVGQHMLKHVVTSDVGQHRPNRVVISDIGHHRPKHVVLNVKKQKILNGDRRSGYYSNVEGNVIIKQIMALWNI